MRNSMFCLLVAVCALFYLVIPIQCQGSALKSLVRRAAKISDDIPVRPLEQAANPETRKMARELFDNGVRHADDALPYSKRLVRQIEQSTGKPLDPHTLRALETMNESGLETAALLTRGAKNIEKSVPDIARRGAFLRQLDGDTLCVIGRFDDLVDDALVFSRGVDDNLIKTTLDASKIGFDPKSIKAASRMVTLDDFGAFFKATGEKGRAFWKNMVQPHWQLFAASGVMAIILLTPEEYLNYAVEVGADGLEKIIRVAGKVAGETIVAVTEGAGEGLVEAAHPFFKSTWGIIVLSLGGLVLIIWVFSQSLVQHFFSWGFWAIRKIKRWLFPPQKLGPDIK